MLLYVVVISYYWTCSFNKKLLISFPLVVALLAIIPSVFPDFCVVIIPSVFPDFCVVSYPFVLPSL